jgi:hypothetical protein
MRIKNPLARSLVVLCTVAGLTIGAAGLAAQERRGVRSASRFSISAAGGMGRTEDHQGLKDLKLGIEYRITSSLRLGLGLGYLVTGRHDREHGGDGSMSRFSWGGAGRMAGESDFRIKAATLDLLYALPVGRKWDVTLGGGGGRYFGEFPRMTEEVHRRSWGGEAGVGVEYRLSTRLGAFAEAGYRFLEFHNIPADRQILPLSWTGESARTLTDIIARGMEMISPQLAPGPMDVRLSGPVLRLGLRFGL